ERASATEAYEHDDEAAPSAEATANVFGESSGRRRSIARFETTACTTAESAKPRISAHKISHVIPNEKLSARQSWWKTISRRAPRSDSPHVRGQSRRTNTASRSESRAPGRRGRRSRRPHSARSGSGSRDRRRASRSRRERRG